MPRIRDRAVLKREMLVAVFRLGAANVLRVILYRFGLRLGFHPVTRISREVEGSEFFSSPAGIDKSLPAPTAWRESARYFGWYTVAHDGWPPDWHQNPFTGQRVPDPETPWWRLPDFGLRVGDIKTVWEASRFEWATAFAQQAHSGDTAALERLNSWLADWCQQNPAYRGVNWKCGQEASIRIMHLAVAARILGQDGSPQPDLQRLLEAHLARIRPTLSYALAQNNNHGTSEAAALFIGGTWCEEQGVVHADRWAQTGRRCLEKLVRRLVEPDGSFSQYSVNYHRLMLDTLCVAELWRRWRSLSPFSIRFYEQARQAAHWLYAFIDPESGEAPNLGSNDGARLIPLTDTDYRDYRPTVQLAMALFAGRRAYPAEDNFNLQLRWLGVPVPDEPVETVDSQQFDHGGYSLPNRGKWRVVFRYPRFRFRPGHCDALHVDLWHGSVNLLRDGGSYSYNTGHQWAGCFSGTASHNTIQFDDRDQMPRLRRFLRGAWLRARGVEPISIDGKSVAAAAGYRDWKGATHHRNVELGTDGLVIRDQVKGFEDRAVLRWRLMPDEWSLIDGKVCNKAYCLKVDADVPIVRRELVQGWESRYYMHKSPLPVLEVEIRQPGTLNSEFKEQPR